MALFDAIIYLFLPDNVKIAIICHFGQKEMKIKFFTKGLMEKQTDNISPDPSTALSTYFDYAQ